MIPVFETALVEGGRIRLRERHAARLRASGASDAQVAQFERLLDEIVTRPDQPFVVRVDVSDDDVAASTRAPRPTTPVDLPTVAAYDPALDIRLLKIADRSWVDVIEATVEGREALLVSRDGLVGETTRAGVIVIDRNGRPVVPKQRGILRSVTRAWAMEQTGAEETDIALADVDNARGAAVVTAARGIIPIASIDGTPLQRAPALDELHAQWRSLP